MSTLTYNNNPPPLELRSLRNGAEKPLIKNWPTGKVLSIFVSEISNMSILSVTKLDKSSNLFLIKFMLRYAINYKPICVP